MPYIKPNARRALISMTENTPISTAEEIILLERVENAGDLQYVMAKLFKSYLSRKELSYQSCNDIMGALTGAQLEFYRRYVAPYEDQKILENGDV